MLSGVVALMVGLLTFPLSLLADRFGRVRSLVVWLAVESGDVGVRAGRYQHMLIARYAWGREAAYGSVGSP
jgi:hypothetical protein